MFNVEYIVNYPSGQFSHKGKLPFFPVAGQHIDIGDGVPRRVESAYFSCSNASMFVVFEDHAEEEINMMVGWEKVD